MPLIITEHPGKEEEINMSGNYNWNFTPKPRGNSFGGFEIPAFNWRGLSWNLQKPLHLSLDCGNTKVFTVDLQIKNLSSGGVTFKFTF